MSQDKLEKEKKWVEDEDHRSDDCDVIELEVGESVEGVLMDKFEFDGAFNKKNWGYIIKQKHHEKPVLLFGSTILNKKLMDKEIGGLLLIERVKDGKNKMGASYKDYKTYHMEV